MKSILRLFASFALLASLAGCFHYVPTTGVPTKGTPVRAHLTRPISVELPQLTANNVVEVTGEVVTAQEDQLILSAFGLQAVGDYQHEARGVTVTLPRDALGLLEERRLSRGRTALAAVALAGAGYLVQLGLRGVTGGGDDGNGTGQPK